MRIVKVTPKNLQFFEDYLTKEEKGRLKAARATALGAVAGTTPCAVLLFTMAAREAHLEKIYVEESFRRRGVAAGLIEQVKTRFPELVIMTCSYQENRFPEFDGLVKGRKDFFFKDESCPVYVVEKEEADSIKLPEGNRMVREFFGMEEYTVRRFMKTEMQKSDAQIDDLLADHSWVEDACLCHREGADIDACLLTERTTEGICLYYAFSGEDGGPAFLSCLNKIMQKVQDGAFPAYEIVCRTDRSRRIFEKLLSGREPDGYLVTACSYL